MSKKHPQPPLPNVAVLELPPAGPNPGLDGQDLYLPPMRLARMEDFYPEEEATPASVVHAQPKTKRPYTGRPMPKSMPGSAKEGGQAWHINQYLLARRGQTVTPKQIATALGYTASRVSGHLAALVRTGHLLQLGGGQYVFGNKAEGAVPPKSN